MHCVSTVSTLEADRGAFKKSLIDRGKLGDSRQQMKAALCNLGVLFCVTCYLVGGNFVVL